MDSFNGKYRLESLSASTFPGALRVILESFVQDEAVCIGSEININPLAAEELLELSANAALDGVSLVAIATDSGEVVSASFNKIQVPPSDASERPFFEIFANERCKQGSSKSLVQFMSDVDERCNLFEKCAADCSLEIMFIATLREHRRQGLASALCRYSIEIAKKLKDGPITTVTVQDLGPKYANMEPPKPLTTYPKICQAIWTGKETQKIGKNLNFTVYLTVPFEEFVYNGKTYADRLGPANPCCEVAALKLY